MTGLSIIYRGDPSPARFRSAALTIHHIGEIKGLRFTISCDVFAKQGPPQSDLMVRCGPPQSYIKVPSTHCSTANVIVPTLRLLESFPPTPFVRGLQPHPHTLDRKLDKPQFSLSTRNQYSMIWYAHSSALHSQYMNDVKEVKSPRVQ